MKTSLPKESLEHEAVIHAVRDIIVGHETHKVAFLILFGSFARGNWVHDCYKENNINYEYASDYDLMIVTKTNKQGTGHAAIRLKNNLYKKLKEYSRPYMPHSPSILVMSIENLNKHLRRGQYFFSDIIKEGVMLYDSGDFQFDEAAELEKAEIKEIAEEHYDQWFDSGAAFLIYCQTPFKLGDYKRSAFLLHQSAEHLLNCALLVLTDYKPKTHSIKDLIKLCSSQNNEFLKIFPIADKIQEENLDLLEAAYIAARYDKDYVITKEQLEYLIERVEFLKSVTETICKERIESLL